MVTEQDLFDIEQVILMTLYFEDGTPRAIANVYRPTSVGRTSSYSTKPKPNIDSPLLYENIPVVVTDRQRQNQADFDKNSTFESHEYVVSYEKQYTITESDLVQLSIKTGDSFELDGKKFNVRTIFDKGERPLFRMILTELRAG